MTDIVTGVAGFVGSHIAEELLREGHNVVGIDNFHPYYKEEIKRKNLEEVKEAAKNSEGDFRFVSGSILNDKDLSDLPPAPETVFHNAAVAGVRNSIKSPAEYKKQNVLGTSKLINHLNPGHLVFASSSSVYGMVPEEELPVKEDRELDPIAPYPQSKKHCEELIELYADLYDFDYTLLRYFTVYGPRQRPDEAFTKFIKMILKNEPVTIYGDGEQSRDFTDVQDIVRANLLAKEREEARKETFNVSSGRRITVNEMVDVLDQVMDENVERKFVDQPEGDARHTHADISKARKKLGYRPEVSFDEGTEKCVEWVRQMNERGLF